MQLRYLQTYTDGCNRIEHVLVALDKITQTEPVFQERINVSVNRALQIKPLLKVTLVDGSKHNVSAKELLSLITFESIGWLKDDD
jgi:hypothetical protein